MNSEIQILVNGNRFKQYQHNGQIYIEAKNGPEYVIEIKNNHWKRIMTVGSVDSINILTGETANSNDSGYIINAYSSEKIKGFRISDNEWAMFKFGYKFNGKTYAQSKEDGSEKNCGVIGIKLFYEKEPDLVYTPRWNDSWIRSSSYNCDISTLKRNLGDDVNTLKSTYYCNNIDYNMSCDCNTTTDTLGFMESPKQNFDMGTEFGRKEHSKVHTVSFDRGHQAQSFDIYYASRESLINMGIPLNNTLQVNLPKSFPNEYCKPPVGWNG